MWNVDSIECIKCMSERDKEGNCVFWYNSATFEWLSLMHLLSTCLRRIMCGQRVGRASLQAGKHSGL